MWNSKKKGCKNTKKKKKGQHGDSKDLVVTTNFWKK